MDLIRCEWPGENELMIHYHDNEWGVPLHDDIKLFEFLVLDTFQAGLSWKTVLMKRENFREAFSRFDAQKIAEYGDREINALLNNSGIIRNKMKINATIENARRFLEIREKHGSFDAYIWQFTDGKTIVNRWSDIAQMPAKTGVSDMMSKKLKEDGFKFAGSTICYAFMQAAGMVNDHIISCFRYNKIISGKY